MFKKRRKIRGEKRKRKKKEMGGAEGVRPKPIGKGFLLAQKEVATSPAERREFGGGGGAAAAELPRASAPHFGEGRQFAICQSCRCTLLPPPSSLPLAPSGFSHLPPRNQQLAPTCPMAALSSALAEESPRD